MKYLKLFEERDMNYKYLNDEQTILVDGLVKGFIKDNKIIENIKKLKLDDFMNDHFDYPEIWIRGIYDLLAKLPEMSKINYNIYQFISIKLNKMNLSNPAISNTLSDILDKLYIEYNIKDKFDEILIKIFDKNPKKYKKIFNEFEYELSDEVKTNC